MAALPRIAVRIAAFLLGTGLFATAAGAQQQALNTPAAGLTVDGAPPVAGTPTDVVLNGGIHFRVQGPGGQPYALLAGELAAVSIPVDPPDDWFDLELATVSIVGDGLGGGPGLLPAAFFQIPATGEAIWGFSVNAALIDARVAVQAVVADPTVPTMPFSFSAAADFLVVDGLDYAGPGVKVRTLNGGPVELFDVAYEAISVAMSGFIRFGGDGTLDEGQPDAVRFAQGWVGAPGTAIAGTPAAIVAPAWTGVGLFVLPVIRIVEREAGLIEVSWRGGKLFEIATGALVPLGEVRCILDLRQPAAKIVFDYTRATIVSSSTTAAGVTTHQGRPIVGLSGGDAIALVAVDFVQGGSLGRFDLLPGSTTLHQDFTAPVQAFDLNGLVLTFEDVQADGGFIGY